MILFRCPHCEVINSIPEEYKHSLCMNCGKIITYSKGEAIIAKNDSKEYREYYRKKLSIKQAKRFFVLADKQEELIEQKQKEKRVAEVQLSEEIVSSSQKDKFLEILQKTDTESLDGLLNVFSKYGIKLKNVEQMLNELKRKGIIFSTKSWLVRVIEKKK